MTCPELRADMKAHLRNNWKIERLKPNPDVHRELERGWMLPAILEGDDHLHGRWEYWFDLMCAQALPDRPIPRIDFEAEPNQAVLRMIEDSLDTIPQHGSWATWGRAEYFRYFLDWILYGCGHQTEAPKEPCEGASDRLYQVFQPGAMQLYPYDYFGHLLAECAYGKRQGFYPTPMHLCELMCGMLMPTGEDLRTKTMSDPCVGTGRFPLVASNHVLRVFAMDIDEIMCKATLVNAFLYAPWVARPLPFLDGPARSEPERLSDSIAAQAPPHIAEKMGPTEPDPEAYRFEPIIKRRKVVASQGALFGTED